MTDIMPKKRTAIFISGRGSNMRSLVEAARAPDYPAEIKLVVSNRPEAGGIAWAVEQGIATVVIDHKTYATRADFETALQAALDTYQIELIALAGFMRLMTPEFVLHWQDRMINIHPSLLPSFKGLHTHERALAAGVVITGCTVHFVRPEMDDGPIIAQAAVRVLAGDTAETLAARILAAEHRVYPVALRLVAAGEAVSEGKKITMFPLVKDDDVLFSPKV
jgi:phosphoribosylglycinamide formyltransferase 1